MGSEGLLSEYVYRKPVFINSSILQKYEFDTFHPNNIPSREPIYTHSAKWPDNGFKST
jgi:hypothetical protein